MYMKYLHLVSFCCQFDKKDFSASFNKLYLLLFYKIKIEKTVNDDCQNTAISTEEVA